MQRLLQPEQTVLDAYGQQFILMPMNAEHAAVTQFASASGQQVF